MRIAITGGSGFVGRHLLHLLVGDGHDVVALTRKPNERPPLSGVRWLQGELGKVSDAQKLVESSDAVVHAALAKTGNSFLSADDDAARYWHENATGSLQLLEAASQSNTRRFVFISSGAVHDQVVGPLNEDHPLRPSTLYGACKASVETLVHHYGFSGRLIASTLRPTAVYGESQPLEDSKWFSLVEQIYRGHAVTATGGAKSVHAADIAKAVKLLLGAEQDAIAGETFNCCDRMISEYEVAELAKSLCQSNAEVLGKPKQAKHQIDTSKLRSLGMQFGGDALLRQTIDGFVRHLRNV